ncbi:MAG TPA: restriction endonuclease subunit S [Flavobacteriaceae bacterium]|nr:restriction endonuclease subunit S [Flavobacteriaceae bacterium]
MENVGQYITKYVKGKVPKQLVEIPSTETLPYLSPDYLRGKANPEFYAAPDDKIILVEDGEVIVLWDGSNAGEIFISKKGILGSTMVKLEFDEEQIFKPYFSYSFQYLEYFLKAKTAGSGIPHADKGVIKKLNFFKPPKPEQTAIATILSKVDKAIAATQNSIKAAEKLKKALMQNLLTGKLKPDGSWRTEDEFYEDEKFGKVPLGWEVKKLKDVCIYGGQYGANASAVDFVEGKPRYIRITDIDDLGNLIEENKAGIEKDKVKDYLLKDNDFLFARTGDTVGKSLLYKEEMGLSAYAGYLIKFTFNEELILAEYFNLVAKSDIFEAFKVAMQRVGAKPNINSREYGSFRFPLSNDINEQQLIFEQAKPINESISRKQTKIQTLQRLKKSLMQNLLTGKVHLPKEVVERLSKLEKEVKNA